MRRRAGKPWSAKAQFLRKQQTCHGGPAAGKSVELFRDMLPSARRVGVLGHATNPVFAKAMLDEVLLAGGPTGTEIQPVVMVRETGELESAFTTMANARLDGLLV